MKLILVSREMDLLRYLNVTFNSTAYHLFPIGQGDTNCVILIIKKLDNIYIQIKTKSNIK